MLAQFIEFELCVHRKQVLSHEAKFLLFIYRPAYMDIHDISHDKGKKTIVKFLCTPLPELNIQGEFCLVTLDTELIKCSSLYKLCVGLPSLE